MNVLKIRRCELVVALTAVLLAAGARAQESLPPPGEWRVSAGAGLLAGPRFPGAGEDKVVPVPLVDARWGPNVFIDLRGIGYELRSPTGLHAYAALGADLNSRRQADGDTVRLLPEVREAGAVRVGLGYSQGPGLVARLGVTQRLGSVEHRGALVDGELGWRWSVGSALTLESGATVRGMDSEFARNFYGITPTQAAATGLRAYDARGGLLQAGGYLQAHYQLSPAWALTGRLNAARLEGDARDSPTVERRNQSSGFLGVVYSF